MIDKDVVHETDEISLSKTFSTQSSSQSLTHHLLCPHDKLSGKFIKPSLSTFQYDFHDPFYAWLEESYLKRFHFHFLLFVNSRYDPILPIIQYEAPQLPILVFDEFNFSELEVLQWLHWLFHFT